MNFGLRASAIEEIIQVFRSHPEIDEVIIFGSRAKKTFQKSSDIDLALKGKISFELLTKIKYQLEEETHLPYFFDVVDYANLKSKELKGDIDQYGEVLYQK